MTNKLFIVKYVLFDVDFCKKVNEKKSDEIDTLLRNLSTNLNKRESFNDMSDFETIFAQNICFFDVANKINEIKINKIMKEIDDEISDEVNDEMSDKVEKFCENIANKTISLNAIETNFLNIDFF